MKYYNSWAIAVILGNLYAPNLYGRVWFSDKSNGVYVCAKVYSLPKNDTGFYGFHVHTVGNCSLPGFAEAKGHYNPQNFPHPLHAGDFPMLIANSNMEAELSFITSRFIVRDIIGRAVIIHEGRDDYSSQPSGDSGKRIGCGIIHAL